jgi:hypothetical protein
MINREKFKRLYKILMDKLISPLYEADFDNIKDIFLEDIHFFIKNFDTASKYFNNKETKLQLDAHYGSLIEIYVKKYIEKHINDMKLHEECDVMIADKNENIYKHFDFKIPNFHKVLSNLNVDFEKILPRKLTKIEVKGMKRIEKSEQRSEVIFIEFLGVSGHLGSIFGESDYFVSYCSDGRLFFIERLLLNEIATKMFFDGIDIKNISDKEAKTYVIPRERKEGSLWDRRYNDNEDLFTYLYLEDIKEFGFYI